MTDPHEVRADFQQMMGRPESELDLARAALLVAAEADPALDIEREMARLEDWARDLRGRLTPGMNNLQKLARLRAYVFEDLGFDGDHQGYYSPANSFLHDVMRRRRGIPLTMAIVLLELGWRVGMPLEGVGFPGHFLVRLAGEPRDLLLDPFRDGMSVHEEDCRRMLLEVTGGRVDYDHRLVASIGKRQMIERLLLNLKSSCLRAGDDAGALAAVERLLLLRPGDAEETRDQGLLLFRLRRYGPARLALERYLAASPAAADRGSVEGHLARLRALLAELN
jgi:regulator of sirC expression with transglutaminase-like and TPR domain